MALAKASHLSMLRNADKARQIWRLAVPTLIPITAAI